MATSQTGPAQGTDGGDRPLNQSFEQVKQEGQRLVSEAKEGVARAAEDRKEATADYLRAMASAVEAGGQELERQGHAGSGALASRAAHDFSDLIDRLARRDTGDLLHEVETFARQRPALFFGAAFLAGFGATRFLKTSAPSAESAPSAAGTRSESGRSAP